MEADIKGAEAKLALTGELIHKPKKTRKIDAKEVAMAETLKSVESKSLAGSDKDSSKSDTENGNSDTLNSDTDVVKISIIGITAIIIKLLMKMQSLLIKTVIIQIQIL